MSFVVLPHNSKPIVMKQPDLGKKISELRKAKGLTQEELVEKCNINVRTIQRIEAGEVTPRSYTVKSILSALDYDWESVKEEFELTEQNAIKVPRNFSLMLNLAFWFGIGLIIVDSFNIFISFALELDFRNSLNFEITNSLYVAVQILSIICVFFFYYGFLLSGKVFNNSLLKVTAILMMIVEISCFTTGAFLFDADKYTTTFYGITTLILYGCAGIPFGIALFRLKKYFGEYATLTGIFSIILYAMMLTVILAIISLFVWIPVIILQVILLYKIREYIETSQKTV